MSRGGPLSERALVVAPMGRDAILAVGILRDAGLTAQSCADVAHLLNEIAAGAGLAIIAHEALRVANLQPLSQWISAQPSWSDFPFLVLIARGYSIDLNPETARLTHILGNVTFVERPFHPSTLISSVQSALRGRRRQYEARERMDKLREINETLETRVEERAMALEATQEQLRQSQKMEAIGQLTGGIAHDFNNLLQGITGSLSLLQRRLKQGRPDGLDPLINGAITSANRAAALTHRLLAFARRQPLDPKAVDVNALILSMSDLLRRSLGEHVQIDFRLADGLWTTLCDPNQLENGILNLCINARDAMPNGGTIVVISANVELSAADVARINYGRPGPYVCISVSDTGVGMDSRTLQRAFDPFFTTKPLGQGTGLGLSMIHGFARQSEGNVLIESQLGVGTTVRLLLPRIEAVATAEAPVPAVMTEGLHSSDTVLVIEDDPIVRGLIVDVLTELSCRTVEAADGPSGLSILQSRDTVDLLITDIGLPGLNGRQVAEVARESKPDLKVLFITGYAENAAVAHGFLEPGMAMLTKPFPMEVLANKIREMMVGDGEVARPRAVASARR